jgi:hypothetical protein
MPASSRVKTLLSFEPMGTAHRKSQRRIPKNVDLQKQGCGSLSSCKALLSTRLLNEVNALHQHLIQLFISICNYLLGLLILKR